MVRPQDRKFVTADPDKCIGCLVCEYACSMVNEKTFNPNKSRIRAMRIGPLVNLAVTCRHCEDPACVAACPRDALKQECDSGIIRVDENACNGCGWCISACQFGAMNMHPDKESRIHMQQLHRQRNQRTTMRQMVPRRSLNIR